MTLNMEMQQASKLYILAPLGGGSHFFCHLARKHYYKEDIESFYCNKYNEYSVPINDTKVMGDVKNMPLFRWVWDYRNKKWYYVEDKQEKNIIITPAHWPHLVPKDDRTIVIQPREFITFKMYYYLQSIKRQFGSAIQPNNIPSDFNLTKWKDVAKQSIQYKEYISPTSKFALNNLINRDKKFIKKVKDIFLVKDTGYEILYEMYYGWKMATKGHSIVVDYEDLITGKTTNTFLDNYTNEIKNYYKQNKNLLKKYKNLLTL